MAVAMAMSLAACGPKEPTAQELVDGIGSIDAKKYSEISLSVDMTYSGGDVDSMSIEADAEVADGIVHLSDVSMNVGSSGFTMKIGLEAWLDLAGDVGYMNLSMFGEETGWAKTDIDDDGSGFDVKDADLSKAVEKLTEGATLELQERDKKSEDDYVVRWTMDADVLKSLAKSIGSGDASSMDISSAEGSMRFDHGSRQLKGLALACDMSMDGEDVTFDLVADIKKLNEDGELFIPEDVVEEASKNGESDVGGLFGFDGADDEVDPGFSVGGGGIGDQPFGQTPGGAQDGTVSSYGDHSNLNMDGEGTDELLDGLAAYLADYDQMGNVYVHHYDGYAVLGWYPATGDEWMGSIELTHYQVVSEYADPRADFENDVKFLGEYTGTEPTYGGMDESDAVFIREGSNSFDLDYVCCGDNGVYIESTIHCYEHKTNDEIMEHLLYLVGAVSSYTG